MDKEIICNICGFVYFDENDHDDFYDCVEYDEQKRGVRKGTWMVEWLMNMKVSQQKPRVTTGDILRANEERAKK